MVRAAQKQYNAHAIETRVRERWEDQKAYEATKRHRAHGEPWYFIDGPPYATGHIHLGTARNKVLKDAVVRWMRMRGRNVRDQPGYDMHGLPIEVKVEKELGFTSKRDIEAYGVDKFVERCRKFALDHEAIMTEEFKDLGVWMDWDRPYRTLTNDYIEGAWWAIAKAHERGLLFESERVLTWCWRCETPLANAEIEFEDRKDPSIYVKFKVADRPGESLVIWTTTPWTLPANVAIAANPDLTYARVRVTRADGGEETLIVVAEQAENLARIGRYQQFNVIETLPGTALEGLRYEHPFKLEVPYHQTPASPRNNTVILGEHVLGDRTGLVHTATGHGVEDYEAGKKYGIPVFSPVGEDGRYTAAAGVLQGLPVKGAPEGETGADTEVIRYLQAKGLLVSEKLEQHAYGHCWRCKNPIVYRATKQWFIDVARLQGRMIEETQRVEWTPEWAGSARQMDWVKNARDWCVSRQRYWGIPLPVWKCQRCDQVTVVGSRHELKSLSPNFDEGMDLHRPWIDQVEVACSCGARKHRVGDVLDVWFDSAVASWAPLGWPSHKAEFERWWPCDWICEGLDQTRGWFYSQLGASVAALDRVPYDSVLMHGWVHDEMGRPFSKSLGNGFPPADVIQKYGRDAMRLTLLGKAAPWDDLNMGVDTSRESVRTLNILWNVHVFATQYMALDRFHAHEHPFGSVKDDLTVEDRWLYSRLQTMTHAVHEAMKKYDVHEAVRTLERFVLDDLSRWYVRLIRDRTWSESPEEAHNKIAVYRTLYDALMTLAKLSAPFLPHVADAIYHDLGGKQVTVHMEDWPRAHDGLIDEGLEREMATAREIVDAVLNARHKANMKLRWPVGKVTITGGPEVATTVQRMEMLLLAQMNAKRIEFVGTSWEGLVLTVEPVKQAIGPAFKGDAPRLLQALRTADARALRQDLDARGEAQLDGLAVRPEHVKFEARLPEHVLGADFTGGSAYIDAEVTEEIKAEGFARDVIRRIQEMRKEMALAVTGEILTSVHAPEDVTALLLPHHGEIARETRTARLTFEETPEGQHVKQWDLEGTQVTIAITPVAPKRIAAPATVEREREPAAVEARGEAPPTTPRTAAPPRKPRAKGPARAPKKAPAKAAAGTTRKPAKTPARAKKATGTKKKASAKKPAKKTPAKKAGAPKKAAAKRKTPSKKPAKSSGKKAGPKKKR